MHATQQSARSLAESSGWVVPSWVEVAATSVHRCFLHVLVAEAPHRAAGTHEDADIAAGEEEKEAE